MRTRKKLFDHPKIRIYDFGDVPLNRDIYLVDVKWMSAYSRALVALVSGGDYKNVGYVSDAAARAVNASSIELSWYPNTYDRFHEVRIVLPKDQFVTCVDCADYDEKPRVFVISDWLSALHLQPYSVFAMIDAIGVKAALQSGTLARSKLIALRSRIDDIAERNPKIAFISFADSLLLKSNWRVGQYDSGVKYSYEPELILRLMPELRSAYAEVLGMRIYAILTQGSNEYDGELLHLSRLRNHISLNSLGLPFAQLMAIENAARAAIRAGMHAPADLYLDERFYRSLRFKYEFNKKATPHSAYESPMSRENSAYYYLSCETLEENLAPPVLTSER